MYHVLWVILKRDFINMWGMINYRPDDRIQPTNPPKGK